MAIFWEGSDEDGPTSFLPFLPVIAGGETLVSRILKKPAVSRPAVEKILSQDIEKIHSDREAGYCRVRINFIKWR